MRVVGTAGHVDHGKSTLVEALTGIDPDRLQEEKDRQMTIDLGFAWMTLPSGEGLGFVDVPGHRDFIENMLAGVGGIDAALLVIAADEGIMPQTREHLAILDLLEIEQLVTVLTRIDLVQEQEWLELVEEDTRRLLSGTRFHGATMLRVSPITGEGLQGLIDVLDRILQTVLRPKTKQKPRLPIDRSFSISGFGTVVTGTLLEGPLTKGQDVEILPARIRARIRGLQTHKQQVGEATPGSRVAANITGASVNQLERGDVVVLPGTDIPTSRLDVQFRGLEDSAVQVRHNASVKFFSGSAQRMGRIRLLRDSPIKGGESGWLQIELERPVVVRRGDHYILRQPSPGSTLGGGKVADPHPARRHKRSDSAVIESLERKLSDDPEDVLLASISGVAPVRLTDAANSANLTLEDAALKVLELKAGGDLQILNPKTPHEEWIVTSAATWEQNVERARGLLEAYHHEHPLRSGMPVEEFRNRLGETGSELMDALADKEVVRRDGNRVRLPDFEVRYTPEQERAMQALMERFASNPYSPPTIKECSEEIGTELLEGLIESSKLIKVSEAVVFAEAAYTSMKERVTEQLVADGEITVAQVRDLFSTSRKYALALMEHFDAIGLTYREGDVRHLVRT